jgi:hypothetical protein
MPAELAPTQNHATRHECAAHRRGHRLPKAAPGACTPTNCPLYAGRLVLARQTSPPSVHLTTHETKAARLMILYRLRLDRRHYGPGRLAERAKVTG